MTKITHSSNSLIALWIFSFITALLFTPSDTGFLIKTLTPLILTILCLTVFKFIPEQNRPTLPYLLFFSISITSALGLTETLTGSHAHSTNPYLYGLSFYSASMAFYLASQVKLNVNETFRFANPLLLLTGPIALFVKKAGQKTLKRRMNYYLPFILIGLFFYQIIASPLTNLFFLIEKTDLVSAIIFATIFEIFVYANFCGLSLIIYGMFGMFGYRIPLNFKQPFSSSNVVDFWKGWHTSLSAVLKVLFYIPLRKKSTQFFSLSGVFVASALWHGVTLNFLIWGIFHAIVFFISLVLLRSKIKVLPMVILVFGVIIGRLIFADSDTNRLLEKLMFSYDGMGAFSVLLEAGNTSKAALILGIGLILIEFFFRKNRYVRKRNYKHLRSPLVLALLVLIGVLLITATGENYAVYGQR